MRPVVAFLAAQRISPEICTRDGCYSCIGAVCTARDKVMRKSFCSDAISEERLINYPVPSISPRVLRRKRIIHTLRRIFAVARPHHVPLKLLSSPHEIRPVALSCEQWRHDVSRYRTVVTRAIIVREHATNLFRFILFISFFLSLSKIYFRTRTNISQR